jgi:hypothetical protein
MNYTIETLGNQAIWMLFLSVFLFVLILCFLLWFGRWVSKNRGSVCPYTKKPMMLGVDLPVSFARQVEEFMKSQPQPENEPFDCCKSAICRETGRIFPNAIKRGEIIWLDWSFLEKRFPGNWVSWGSLPLDKQGVIKLCHTSLDGFQTEKSAPQQLPEHIGQDYIYTKPGPLYVDVAKKTLLGWKCVPGTYLEVLIVQKPQYDSIDETI